MSQIRVASLNIWKQNDWSSRLPYIVEALKERSPDIVVLQEAQTGVGVDQVAELAQKASYPYHQHFPFTEKGELSHGLGILSRIPFTATPHKHEYVRTEQRGFVETKHIINDSEISVVNVHFDNTDEGSLIHLREVFEKLGDTAQQTIIAGDFNCFDSKTVSEISAASHTNSYNVTPYISYPGEGTLDYILVPNAMKIDSVVCVDKKLSDHRMIFVDIEI